jgi:hypothetical protein
MKTESYYLLHRKHAVRFLIAAVLLSWTLIAAILSGYYDALMLCIWLMMASMFLTLVAVVEFRCCEEYHTKYLRELRPKLPPNYPN